MWVLYVTFAQDTLYKNLYERLGTPNMEICFTEKEEANIWANSLDKEFTIEAWQICEEYV